MALNELCTHHSLKRGMLDMHGWFKIEDTAAAQVTEEIMGLERAVMKKN
jgi:hypothetical protein